MLLERTRKATPRLMHRAPPPALAVLGAVVVVAGLGADLVVHLAPESAPMGLEDGFSLGEHAAHLMVLVGMVLVLAGAVVDGVRTARRQGHQEGSSLDAIR